jgi:hypothetical protein
VEQKQYLNNANEETHQNQQLEESKNEIVFQIEKVSKSDKSRNHYRQSEKTYQGDENNNQLPKMDTYPESKH